MGRHDTTGSAGSVASTLGQNTWRRPHQIPALRMREPLCIPTPEKAEEAEGGQFSAGVMASRSKAEASVPPGFIVMHHLVGTEPRNADETEGCDVEPAAVLACSLHERSSYR